MSQRWRAIKNIVSCLTSPKFEPQTACSRDERDIPLDHQLACINILILLNKNLFCKI